MIDLSIIGRLEVLNEPVIQLLIAALLSRLGSEVFLFDSLLFVRLSDQLRFLPQNILLFLIQCVMNRLVVSLDTLRMTQVLTLLVDDGLEVRASHSRVNAQRPRALAQAISETKAGLSKESAI